jgi:hypothetical protein
MGPAPRGVLRRAAKDNGMHPEYSICSAFTQIDLTRLSREVGFLAPHRTSPPHTAHFDEILAFIGPAAAARQGAVSGWRITPA